MAQGANYDKLVIPNRPPSLSSEKDGRYYLSYYYRMGNIIDSGLLEGTVEVDGNLLICTTLKASTRQKDVEDKLPTMIFEFSDGQLICQHPDKRILTDDIILEMYNFYK